MVGGFDIYEDEEEYSEEEETKAEPSEAENGGQGKKGHGKRRKSGNLKQTYYMKF